MMLSKSFELLPFIRNLVEICVSLFQNLIFIFNDYSNSNLKKRSLFFQIAHYYLLLEINNFDCGKNNQKKKLGIQAQAKLKL